MGLDMYLSAKKFIYPDFDGHKEMNDQLAHVRLPKPLSRVERIECEAMYWRKANAIHKWFVDNVQGGKDECRAHYVDRNQLQELLDTVNKVLEDKDLAPDLLPTESGFFFGSTEFDDWYWHQAKYTRDRLTEILSDPELESWDFQYQSSW